MDETELDTFIDGGGIIVCNVSGGAGSALALYRLLRKYPGAGNVIPIFADTRSETPDTYEFLDQIEEIMDCRIRRLSDGRDIWDVFMDSRILRIMNAGGACKASVELKQIPLARYVKERFTPEECVIATGLDWMEPERQERLTKRLLPYRTTYPLNWERGLSRCEIIAVLEDIGLKTPEVYAKGWPHNNCGKYGCILAGQKQWAGLLEDYPEAFDRAEAKEQAFRDEVDPDFAILRDRRGGQTKGYPLKVLRDDVANGRHFGDSWRTMCNCMGTADEQMNIFDMLEGCV